MEEKKDLLEKFINEQVVKLDNKRKEMDESGKQYLPVITISASPGSLGSKMAENLAKALGFDFYHREIIEAVAKSAHTSSSVINSIERERFSGLEDFIASLVRKDYIWPGLYMEHLEKVVHAIGRRGHSVIVGRGVNFILPTEKRLSVRTVASFEKRKENIIKEFDTSAEQAEERIRRRESRRTDYVKKSFSADINNPANYDLVINTGEMNLEDCTDIVKIFYFKKFSVSYPKKD